MGKYQSGQMGQTVNLLSFDFGGSNPSLPRRFCMDEKTNLVEVKLSFPLYCIANE